MAKMVKKAVRGFARAKARAGLLCALAMVGAAAVSCAQPTHYFGIPLAGSVSDAEQARLAQALARNEQLESPCRWRPADQQRAFAIACGSVPLVAVTRAASEGDKHAQLELGVRFENGIGVAQDWAKALKLYRMAGTDSRSVEAISAPNYSGTLLSNPEIGVVDTTQPSMARNAYPGRPAVPGLAEARVRYQALKHKLASD